MRRSPQTVATFDPGRPAAGYYNDLRSAAEGTPATVGERLTALRADPARVNHVTLVQLGLGAWQRADEQDGWLGVVERTVDAVTAELGDDGVLWYRFAMPHTYPLSAPWASAMAQGQAASLLVRAAASLGRPELVDDAFRAAAPLLHGTGRLVASTREGPVLQEYPTEPPAHVLNGWIFALFGLFDVSAVEDSERSGTAAEAFTAGAATLAARLPRYELAGAWTRYDLYPHPLPNVASPFYHRLHAELVGALARLHPDPRLDDAAEKWRRSASAAAPTALAVARKVAFRIVRPRSRAA